MRDTIKILLEAHALILIEAHPPDLNAKILIFQAN